MGAFMPITNSIIITNITELTNIINSNIIQTNFITEIITNTTTSLGDPTLWITLFGAIFTCYYRWDYVTICQGNEKAI